MERVGAFALMASSKSNPRASLPRRFQPLFDQASAETAVKYGPQEDALKSIFGSTTHDYRENAAAQKAAFGSYLGALQAAPAQLNQVYSDLGLSPSLLSSLGPTGARVASELASAQVGLQQQQLGAQAGSGYQQQHLADQYQQDVGKINDQATSLERTRGTDMASLLDSLISGDRSSRHAANVAAAQQQFTADQNAAARTQQERDALIGAGQNPDTGSPLARASSAAP